MLVLLCVFSLAEDFCKVAHRVSCSCEVWVSQGKGFFRIKQRVFLSFAGMGRLGKGS